MIDHDRNRPRDYARFFVHYAVVLFKCRVLHRHDDAWCWHHTAA